MNSPRTWIEIDAAAFDHNIAQYKKVIQDRFLSVVVKANAYGHGIIEIGQLAQENPAVHMLCVANLSEAILLRSHSITKPILVLSTIDHDMAHLSGTNIHVAVFNKTMIDEINQAGKTYNAIIPIHLKIDTGLSRLGIAPEHAQELLNYIATLSHVSLTGIYSHFAQSSNPDQSYTLEQMAKFKNLISSLKQTPPYIHIANSAGTTSLDLDFCTMFRIGCGIYGAWPSQANKKITQELYPDFDLKPILTWKTRINYINTIKAGSSIGYDRTFIAHRDTTIATLPVGYSDGYDFKLFNKASVLVNGSYAPIIGRISMNVMTIDITDIPDTKAADEVILIGQDAPMDPYSLGMLAGNLNVREIMTKISPTIIRHITNRVDLPYKKLYSLMMHKVQNQ